MQYRVYVDSREVITVESDLHPEFREGEMTFYNDFEKTDLRAVFKTDKVIGYKAVEED